MKKEEILSRFEARKNRDLVLSLLIDAVGCASYLIPAMAELSDVLVAPLSAAAIYWVHKTKVGAALGFVEEILPFSDIIPTATILWIKRYQISREATLREFVAEVTHDEHVVDDILNRKGGNTKTIVID
jgi:hypothetical protein